MPSSRSGSRAASHELPPLHPGSSEGLFMAIEDGSPAKLRVSPRHQRCRRGSLLLCVEVAVRACTLVQRAVCLPPLHLSFLLWGRIFMCAHKGEGVFTALWPAPLHEPNPPTWRACKTSHSRAHSMPSSQPFPLHCTHWQQHTSAHSCVPTASVVELTCHIHSCTCKRSLHEPSAYGMCCS